MTQIQHLMDGYGKYHERQNKASKRGSINSPGRQEATLSTMNKVPGVVVKKRSRG